jgi:hypothetical protein
MDSSNHLHDFLSKFPLQCDRQQFVPIKMLLCASASGHDAEHTLVNDLFTHTSIINMYAFVYTSLFVQRYLSSKTLNG